MTNDDIVEKIQKLLALAGSPNEHEAKLAAAMAHKMLSKYNLSMDEVHTHQTHKEYVTLSKDDGKARETQEDRFVFSILQQHFFVRIIVCKRKFNRSTGAKGEYSFMMLGKTHNVQIATFVYSFLVQAMRKGFADYRAATGAALRARKSYYAGFGVGLDRQLRQNDGNQTQNEKALVKKQDSDLKSYVEKMGAEMGAGEMAAKRIRISDANAAAAGIKDGASTRIAVGLEAAEKEQLHNQLKLEHKVAI